MIDLADHVDPTRLPTKDTIGDEASTPSST
jgi:hypothetical protein